MTTLSFQSRFCSHFRCPENHFQEQFFFKCCGFKNLFFLRLVWALESPAIVEARKCLAEIARSFTWEQVEEALIEYDFALQRANLSDSKLRMSLASAVRVYRVVAGEKKQELIEA